MIDILFAGEEGKYFVNIDYESFDMSKDDFELTLLWGMEGQQLTLTKQDMTADSSGKYFFIFDTKEMTGKVTARCTWWVPDSDDTEDSVRELRDEQVICFVARTACPQLLYCKKSCYDTGYVTYERTTESGISSQYQRLCTNAGQPIVADDDLYLYVLTA